MGGKSDIATPPSGYGADPAEIALWSPPRFVRHPLTQRLEVPDVGLFFRLWPENVATLMRMKADGWTHLEIQRVARELWTAQAKAAESDQKMMGQQRQHMQAAQSDAGTSIHEYTPDQSSGFQRAIGKSDPVGGQRTPTPEEAKNRDSMEWTRHSAGVGDSARTPHAVLTGKSRRGLVATATVEPGSEVKDLKDPVTQTVPDRQP